MERLSWKLWEWLWTGLFDGTRRAKHTRVKHVLVALILLSLSVRANLSRAESLGSDGTCPVNMALNFEEHDALIGFNSRLSHLNDHYGKPSFQTKLNQILASSWPEAKVIEISPVFMEKALNLVEQEHLKNAIAKTVGLDHRLWGDFYRVVRKVTFHTGLTENKHGGFTRKTQALIEAIKNLNERQMKVRVSREERDILKADAIHRIAKLVVYLERWSILNREISIQRADAAGKQFFLNAIGLTAGGLLVASIIYAGPIVAGAGAFGASLTTNAAAAVQLARLGQVVAGAGLGAGGAPTALLLTDVNSQVLTAQRAAAAFDTVYACELDVQMKAWRERGVSPYLNASLVGGGIGLGGGLLTLTAAGAKVVLLATTFGVGVAQLYSVGAMNDNGMKSLAEYRLAIEAHERGDNATARRHLQNSRLYAQRSGERALEGIIVAALSVSIGATFKSALFEGESAIRVIFANSSDTLPLAFGIAKDALIR